MITLRFIVPTDPKTFRAYVLRCWKPPAGGRVQLQALRRAGNALTADAAHIDESNAPGPARVTPLREALRLETLALSRERTKVTLEVRYHYLLLARAADLLDLIAEAWPEARASLRVVDVMWTENETQEALLQAFLARVLPAEVAEAAAEAEPTEAAPEPEPAEPTEAAAEAEPTPEPEPAEPAEAAAEAEPAAEKIDPDDIPRWGTRRDLSTREVRDIVRRCREFQKLPGGSVAKFYEQESRKWSAEEGPKSYSCKTLEAWLRNPFFETGGKIGKS